MVPGVTKIQAQWSTHTTSSYYRIFSTWNTKILKHKEVGSECTCQHQVITGFFQRGTLKFSNTRKLEVNAHVTPTEVDNLL